MQKTIRERDTVTTFNIVCDHLFLPLLFFVLESTRAILWVSRIAHEADAEAEHDGPLLRALCARVIAVLGVVPVPRVVRRVVAGVVWLVVWPVRGMLWVWGIGRGGSKKRASRVRG